MSLAHRCRETRTHPLPIPRLRRMSSVGIDLRAHFHPNNIPIHPSLHPTALHSLDSTALMSTARQAGARRRLPPGKSLRRHQCHRARVPLSHLPDPWTALSLAGEEPATLALELLIVSDPPFIVWLGLKQAIGSCSIRDALPKAHAMDDEPSWQESGRTNRRPIPTSQRRDAPRESACWAEDERMSAQPPYN